VGTAARVSEGSGAATTGNRAFSSRYRRNAVLVQMNAALPARKSWLGIL
jgi:hypothetical protein